jgi:hypothetical protein
MREARTTTALLSPDHIQGLLAAINKIEKRDQSQLVPPDYSKASPLNAPTHLARRVAEVLDALAFLLVSRAKHEVIATALRVDNQNQTVEVMVAANADVPQDTVHNLKTIWDSIEDISALYQETDTCYRYRELCGISATRLRLCPVQ